jgi:hypothetical protein
MAFILFQVLKVVKDIERTGEKTEGNKGHNRFSKQREIEDILGKNYGGKDKKVFDPLLRTGRDENFFGNHLVKYFYIFIGPRIQIILIAFILSKPVDSSANQNFLKKALDKKHFHNIITLYYKVLCKLKRRSNGRATSAR